ncbi:chaperone modulator CbpM [Zavarzinia aquatilis]|uniref:Uncharacterized protein n=1 Tax=Zavarzinia aquatilis TaxID=2211142 RepID=A0A317E847_9PROT|nr:chaperone modulator CbpM [Zavarzinia aquatilis]PWR21275.1 hypothetical protein DKG74_14590 [Zavarzinia aquatilis]
MTRYTETQVVAAAGLTLTELRTYVAEGWVLPRDDEADPAFDEFDLARIRLVCQLRGELDLDPGALPVVLSLLDQIHGLRRQMRLLATAIAAEPEDVRRRIESAIRTVTG